jgi:hypothetical protein
VRITLRSIQQGKVTRNPIGPRSPQTYTCSDLAEAVHQANSRAHREVDGGRVFGQLLGDKHAWADGRVAEQTKEFP